MNLLKTSASGGKATLVKLSIAVPASAGSSVIVGIRPEGLMAASDGFAVTVEVVEELGSDAFVYGQPADSSIAFAQDSEDAEDCGQIIVRWDPKNPPKPGDTITVSAESSSVHLFNAQSGERLN